VHTLDELKLIAEMNLCVNCRKLYAALIEPPVKAMISEFFHDWQGVEANVRFILAYNADAFKKRPYPFDIGKEESLEPFAADIDLDAYNGIRDLKFSEMVYELQLRDIIKKNLHGLLMEIARRRNQIHHHKVEIPEIDRILFSKVHQLLWRWSLWLMDEVFHSQMEGLIESIESESNIILAELKKQDTASR
jgi:hypothetical protein